MYVYTFARRVHVCVCMFTYMHAEFAGVVCACLHVHTLLHMCMYVFTYTNAEFACVRVHSYTWMGIYMFHTDMYL